MRTLWLIFWFIPLVAFGNKVDERDVARILQRLDHELNISDDYLWHRTAHIDSIKATLIASRASDYAHMAALLELGDAYNAYKVDSALAYYTIGYNEARSIGDDSVAARFAMRQATFLPLLLFINDALNKVDSLSRSGFPQGLTAEFYDAERQMCNYISLYYTDHPRIYNIFSEREGEMRALLLECLAEGSAQYDFNLAEQYYHRGMPGEAKGLLITLTRSIDESNPLYARAAHLLSKIAEDEEYELAQIYYLAQSAISDVRCANLEVASLQELGQLLFNRGDEDRAYRYLSYALRSAVECHVSPRIIQTSKVLPIIQQAHQAQIQASQLRIYIGMGILFALFLILLIQSRTLYLKNRSHLRMALRLEEANRNKDFYISQFLNLCSTYMDKLHQFNQLVARKISTGKEDDLLKLTKSGKLIEEQTAEFYEIFDDAFLNIYPSFVDDINALLQPDKQVTLREGEKLNTDLRILALMRLGIDDTSRIAQMLNYSVYTIYTYRNKFKARAIDRDTFDQDIMRIKSI